MECEGSPLARAGHESPVLHGEVARGDGLGAQAVEEGDLGARGDAHCERRCNQDAGRAWSLDLPDTYESLPPVPVWLLHPLAQTCWLFIFHSCLSSTCPDLASALLPVPFCFLGILLQKPNFITYLLSAYFVAGTVLGIGHQRVSFTLEEITFSKGK